MPPPHRGLYWLETRATNLRPALVAPVFTASAQPALAVRRKNLMIACDTREGQHMTKTIDLYYWPTPNGWKISIALEEMGLPYTTHLIDISAGDQFAPAFLEIAPNNRMPAIVDPDGPDGAPISIFESGAILLYLARKTGQFQGDTERDRVAVEQWLMWQMGGVGPMAGQAHHFIKYAPRMDPPQDLPYARDRYRAEVGRLYGVLDRQLAKHAHVAGDAYSIADMAIWPWASLWKGQEQTLDDKPNLARWLKSVGDRPAVQAGRALAAEKRQDLQNDKAAQDLLFKRK
jgi:GST-like protein